MKKATDIEIARARGAVDAAYREFLRATSALHEVLLGADGAAGVDDWRVIAVVVTEEFRVSLGDLLSKRRTAEVAGARQMAMYLTRELLRWTYQRVGACYERDHGTVMWAREAVIDRASVDRVYAARLDRVRARCEQALVPVAEVAA